MNAKRFSIPRHSRVALAGGGAVVCVFGAMGALASCNDPTAGKSFPLPRLQPSTSLSTCPNGTNAVAGPIPDAGYCESVNWAAFNEDCMPGPDWVPGPGLPPVPVRMFTPPPHPDTECPFYRGAYQNFMIATTPLGTNAGTGQSPSDPALVNYPTIDDAFQFTIPHLTRNTGSTYPTGVAAHAALVDAGTPTGRAWLGAVRQAGQRNVLVDQDDHTLYYGLHMNQAFYDFIQQNALNTVNGVLNVDPSLSFPPGLVEFKTAWKDIDPQDFANGVVPPPPPGDYGLSGGSQFLIPNGQGVLPSGTADPTWDDNYITTTAWLPYLTQDSNGIMREDADHPRLRKVALIAIHAVYTLPGHPEFVWGSVQHVNLNVYDPAPIEFAGVYIQGAPDSQPYGTSDAGVPAYPGPSDPENLTVAISPSQNNWPFFKGATLENNALQPLASNELNFDEATQSFPNQGAQENVYRMFPGSKSTHLEPDTAVFSLNSNLNYLYANAISAGNINPAVDKRFNYRLVAAIWMDKPYFFGTNYPGIPIAAGAPPQGPGEPLQNDSTNPMVIGVCGVQPPGSTSCTPPATLNLYPNVSQGTFCGTPLDSTNTSGDSPDANGTNNTVPGCSTRADDLAWGDNPVELYATQFFQGGGPNDSPGGAACNPTCGDPTNPGGVPPIFALGTDYEFSLLGGEDRLSSTVMETFTQNNTFHNCFACHNTEPVSTNGVPYDPNNPGGQQPLLTRPANMNVSHLFSEFILRDATEVCSAAQIPCPGQLDAGAAGH